MNDRERLIELLTHDCVLRAELYNIEVCRDMGTTDCEHCYGKLADHLIANRVTVQKHGRWEIKADDDDYEYAMCPCCGEEFYDPNGEDTIDTFMNYCPNCGAKMDADV